MNREGELQYNTLRNGEACADCRPETSVLWLLGALGALAAILCSYYFVRLGFLLSVNHGLEQVSEHFHDLFGIGTWLFWSVSYFGHQGHERVVQSF